MEYFKTVKRVRKLTAPGVLPDVGFFLLCAAVAALSIYEPILLSRLLDGVGVREIGFFDAGVLWVLGVFLVRIGLDFYKAYAALRYRGVCASALSEAVFSHLLRAKLPYYDFHTPTYLVSRTVDDALGTESALDFTMIDGVVSILLCLAALACMAALSPLLTAVMLAMLAADNAVIFKLPLTRVYRDYNESNAKFRSEAANVFQGIWQIKVGGRYESEAAAFSGKLKEFLRLLLRRDVYRQTQRATGVTCKQLGYLLVIVVSAALISRRTLTIGQFAMAIGFYNLLWSAAAPAVNLIPLYKYGKVACDRLCEVLDTETEFAAQPPGGRDAEKLESIGFRDVRFAYAEGAPVLKAVSLDARAGRVVSLAGYSGSGKSTMLNLILGFISPQSGAVLVNGSPVTQSECVRLRRRIGYVSQRSFLFNRSIRDNLLYCVEPTGENEEKARALIRRFALEPLLESLPGGINYVFGESASTISGGEKQRLCIIRELMKSPELLILDEATSSLDRPRSGWCWTRSRKSPRTEIRSFCRSRTRRRFWRSATRYTW